MASRRTNLTSRAALARLSEELRALEPAYEDECGARPNEAETAFAQLARTKGKTAIRNGWPDFLVLDEASGGTIGVEVKQGGDMVSAAQARMFAALERAGITVMVWNPDRSSALQPWRRFAERAVVDAAPQARPQARLPKLGRMRSANGRHR